MSGPASEVRTLLLATGLAVTVSALTTTLVLANRPALSPIRVPLAPTAASETTPAPMSKPLAAPVPGDLGRDIRGEVSETRGASKLFLFQVPDDAVEVDVSVRNPDGDVDLRAMCAVAAPERDGEWSWTAHDEDGAVKLSLTRHAEPDLRAGPFLVEVRPANAEGHHGDRRSLPFTLRVGATRLAEPGAIEPGRGVDAETSPETGHRRDFVLDVPAGAKTLRIDVVEAARDVDLLVSTRSPPLDHDAADWKAASALARESLVLDGESAPKLPAGGKLWIGVVDPSLYDAPVTFRLVVTIGAEPPAEALALPELPQPPDPRDRAVAAVVEIIVDDGSGSGTIVTDDGLVLTARHVVGDRTGADGDISIAMDLDPTNVTRDLFRAKVEKSDAGLDVALLRITSGLYGQPLPKDYRFPACPVSFDGVPRLGDELVTIGFPEPAGTGTRAPVMFSKGVVSGFEREKSGLRIKTDAFVAAGSSGGAALDARLRLVGVPVFTMSDNDHSSLLGYLVPVTELPRDWRGMIGR